MPSKPKRRQKPDISSTTAQDHTNCTSGSTGASTHTELVSRRYSESQHSAGVEESSDSTKETEKDKSEHLKNKGERPRSPAPEESKQPPGDINRDASNPTTMADNAANNARRFQVPPVLPRAGENLMYEPEAMYDRLFNRNCRPITLQSIDNFEDNLSNDSSDDDGQEDIVIPATPFLFLVLLHISRPKSDKSILSYTAYRNSMGKRGKHEANYKCKYTWGDCNDPSGKTCVILETSNDSHNLFFHHNKAHTGFTVGQKFAIQSPRAVGRLPTGSVVIETDQPFIQLRGPTLRPVTFNSNTAAHDLRYFVLKRVTIRWSKTHLPVCWKTSCNSTVCDRLQFRNTTTQICGCFGQNSKNDTSARNCILKFDLSFDDSERNRVKVVNFTSLRTSRLFFRNQTIIGDYDSLSASENKTIIQQKFMRAVRHINQNGGWTIVGWHIRGEVEDDSKEIGDTNRLSEKLRPNISYLYPSTMNPGQLPDTCTFGPEDLQLRAAPGDHAQEGGADDNL